MTVNNSLVPGQIVKSKAGHDKGDVFVVIKVLDCDYVLVADGNRRKTDNPKKKKVKHLQRYKKVDKTIAENLANGIIIEKERKSERQC